MNIYVTTRFLCIAFLFEMVTWPSSHLGCSARILFVAILKAHSPLKSTQVYPNFIATKLDGYVKSRSSKMAVWMQGALFSHTIMTQVIGICLSVCLSVCTHHAIVTRGHSIMEKFSCPENETCVTPQSKCHGKVWGSCHGKVELPWEWNLWPPCSQCYGEWNLYDPPFTMLWKSWRLVFWTQKNFSPLAGMKPVWPLPLPWLQHHGD